MGDFRRDKNLFKRTINEESLSDIDVILEEVEKRLLAQKARGYCYLSFVIRYDEKGYRLFSYDEFLEHYKKANQIERIVFRLDVSNTIPPGMSGQESIDLYISSHPNENSYLAVEGEDIHWVNSTFSMLDDCLKRFNSTHSWIRGKWVPLLIQMLGVVGIFFSSLVLSHHTYQHLNVESPLFLAFLFFFLIFSNLWTYLNPFILNLVFKVFPNIHFKRLGKSGILESVHEKILAGLLAGGGLCVVMAWGFIVSTLRGFFR